MEKNQKLTLLKWRSRYKRAQMTHNNAVTYYGRSHLIIGCSLIIATTIATGLTLAKFEGWYSKIPIIISMIATILASLQTFLNFSENKEIHRVIARKYGEIKKELEYIIEFSPDASKLPDMVSDIMKKEKSIAEDSPNAPYRTWKKAKKDTYKENEKYSIRNRERED